MKDTGGVPRDYNRVRNGFRGDWKESEPMRLHTSWRIGGPADVFAVPVDVADLALLIRNCQDNGTPWLVVGGGSNLLVADRGIRGVVIYLGSKFGQKELAGTFFSAGAACRLPALARFTARHGLRGLEFAAGIPATLGGAVVMNAGAHGRTLGDVVRMVEVIDGAGQLKRLIQSQLGFGYRRSCLQGKKGVVIRVEMELSFDVREAVERDLAAVLQQRRASQPLEWPNAGSVFINPPGQVAGGLIETAGLKGFAVGGAQVSTRHANFIINTGGATAADVLAVMATVKNRVLATCGVELESEIRVVGDTGGAG
ncbi:MAG: UDP-N-acetylmuramate dehydrogenase [Heliobacteriaceae bacterium]|nr:UDP-N-acetylmuramate dehydrogenase [Heliobacteriaceae bacterium]MDD4588075.1 UDP-N-acetylmuramate dehydrogenase [Heliobacteriaceae bacterium]